MLKITLSVLFLFGFINFSYSQLVNIEKERKDQKEGFQGAITFGLISNKTTSSIFQANNTIHLQYIIHKNTFLILNDYSMIKVKIDENNTDLVNKNFQHFRYNYSIVDTNKIVYELFLQRQQNKVKYLKLRALAGTGIRFGIIDNNKISLYVASLGMYEKEYLTDSAQTITESIKGDFYSSFTLSFSDNFLFKNVIYYQPALVNLNNYKDFEFMKDYRVFLESSMKFKIFKNIFYELQFQMSYDSRPPAELLNTPLFYTFKNQLTFKF